MRFLIAFVAILGYASASAYAPFAYGVNPGDAQAAAIDATVYSQDHARAVGDANRDINENAYWGSVAANQNGIAAAQSYAAAASGAAAAHDGLAASYVAGPAGYAGYAGYGGWAAPYGIAAPYGAHGFGYRGW